MNRESGETMAETVVLKCPTCQMPLRAPVDLGEHTARCSRCGTTVTQAMVNAALAPAPGPAPEPVRPPAESESAQGSTPQPQWGGAQPHRAPPSGGLGAAPNQGVVRANRVLAGKPCPACGREVLLGEEVVRCTRCGEVNHARCWQSVGGCSAATCSEIKVAAARDLPTATPAPTGTASAAHTKPCRVCAEQIPYYATVCPFCSESQTWAYPVPAAPAQFATIFTAKSRGTWSFQLTPGELVGVSPRRDEEIRVRREEALREIALLKRKFFIQKDGARRAFRVGEEAGLALEYWLTGAVAPRTCRFASEALVWAILAWMLCPILGDIFALIDAGKAKRMIDRNPTVFTGRGMATAATVLAIVHLCLTPVSVFIRALAEGH